MLAVLAVLVVVVVVAAVADRRWSVPVLAVATVLQATCTQSLNAQWIESLFVSLALMPTNRSALDAARPPKMFTHDDRVLPWPKNKPILRFSLCE